MIPENGFIGINVPLTEARNGSLSTDRPIRTAMQRLHGCVAALGIDEPDQLTRSVIMTKGEMLAASRDQTTPHKYARDALVRPSRGTPIREACAG